MSSLPPRHVVCHNPLCVYESQLRQVHPIRIGIDLFTYPPAYCACNPSVELKIAPAPEPQDVVLPAMGQLPEEYATVKAMPPDRSWATLAPVSADIRTQVAKVTTGTVWLNPDGSVVTDIPSPTAGSAVVDL